MSKILKNQTGSPVTINDVGQTVPASGQITVQASDYLLYATSSDIITLLGNGTLIVNDGSADLSISDGTNLIKGIFPNPVGVEGSDGTQIGNIGDSLKTVSINEEANRSAFGDNLSESLEPISQISAVYGITEKIEDFLGGTGSIVPTDNMFEMSTGTGIGGYGVVRTSRSTIYREGQGLMGRLTTIFDGNATANSLQFGGFFSLTDTLAFGYDGADFGVIYQSYGQAEIRELDITTAGNGTLALTLNGVVYNIPITTGTIAHNAYEIEDWLNTNQSVWTAEQIGDKVVFQARSTGAKSGTYSISGASLAGTFSQNQAGADKTSNNVTRSNWDNDPSWFDPTKSNVYMIKISYLGFGPIKFFIMNTSTGNYELVHTIKPLGTATKPSISKRALKIGWTCASLGSTTNLTVKGASAATFIEGESKVFSRGRVAFNGNTSVGSVFEAIVTLRAATVYADKVNLGRLVPTFVSIATDSTKPVEYVVVKNAILGETNYTEYDSVNSIAHVDYGDHTYSGTDGVFGSVVSAGGSALVNVTELDIELALGETLTVFARKTSGTNPEVDASITWREDV